MCKEQNNEPVGYTSNNQQVVDQSLVEVCQQTAEQTLSDGTQELRSYYLRQSRLMFPTMSEDTSDYLRLFALHKRTKRIIEMLKLFEHPYHEELPTLQKFCLQFLIVNNITRKERERIVGVWTGWTDFQFRLAGCRGMLSQFLQYYLRVGDELESLLHPAEAEASREAQEIKGGE